MDSRPEISLVILTYNQKALTLRCLESLRCFLESGDNEVIVVDNGSCDDTVAAITGRFPQVKIIRMDENKGVAAGRNAALSVAGGRYLMILDNDTIASAEAIYSLRDYLASHLDVGLVAPLLVSPQGETQTSFRPYPGIVAKLNNIFRGRHRSSVERGSGAPAHELEPFYVIGAAQMFPHDVWEAAGPLDENIFYGPEDADFCMAVRSKGGRVVYLPSVTIVHDWQRATTSNLFSAAARRHIMALLYFWRKHRRFLW